MLYKQGRDCTVRKKPGHMGETRQAQKRGHSVLPRAVAGRKPEVGREGGRYVGWCWRDVSSSRSVWLWERAVGLRGSRMHSALRHEKPGCGNPHTHGALLAGISGDLPSMASVTERHSQPAGSDVI